ncbi:glycosyltransferase [Enterovibrio norvegicus FF-454]|uniref:Glycosyltransferase n=1 Tax=Enterovibrio norvegicus FF-454 TaxID=1185651 RepID=A0A1E5C6N1_9GAMM|nr:glycosyltransferase [Enterovibrio norvegicus FF-454]
MKVPDIYVISLPRCTDRREKVAKEMAEKSIEFAFFDGIDGHAAIPVLAEDYDYPKRLWLTSGKMPSKGELGCYASHYLMWLKCIELNRPIIVCEDDIELHENALEIANFALNKVQELGFIRLQSINEGGDFTNIFEVADFQINLMKDNYGGLCAYAISPSAAAKLVKHRWCLPVDCFVGANFIHGQYSYQLTPNFMAEHVGIESTIQHKDSFKTPIYRKLSRELYTAYKKIMLSVMYRKKLQDMSK